jgi:hypothetical protein
MEQPADMEGSCEYVGKVVADSRKRVILQLEWLGVGLTFVNLKHQ